MQTHTYTHTQTASVRVFLRVCIFQSDKWEPTGITTVIYVQAAALIHPEENQDQ